MGPPGPGDVEEPRGHLQTERRLDVSLRRAGVLLLPLRHGASNLGGGETLGGVEAGGAQRPLHEPDPRAGLDRLEEAGRPPAVGDPEEGEERIAHGIVVCPSITVTGYFVEPLKAKTRLEKFEAQAKRSYINEAALIDHAIDREIKEILDDPYQKLSEKKRVASSEYRGERRQTLLKQAKEKYEHATETMKKNVESDLARCYVARNTAYAFYGGSEVARYHKRNNFYEVTGDESDEGFVIFEPGGGPDGKGDLFTIDGVKFGIEVCYDHTVGHMSQLTTNRPDVQIVMSAAVKIVNEHVTVPKDGYLVHASSEEDGTAAYWNSGKKISKMPMTEEQAERGLLRYAILTFEVEEPLTLEEWISSNK